MTDETELTAEERAEWPDDATIAEWMIESQQDMPVIVASVMALHGRLMSALREVCRLREEAHERERDLTCAEWNVESNARAIKSIAAELAAERARTPAATAPSEEGWDNAELWRRLTAAWSALASLKTICGIGKADNDTLIAAVIALRDGVGPAATAAPPDESAGADVEHELNCPAHPDHAECVCDIIRANEAAPTTTALPRCTDGVGTWQQCTRAAGHDGDHENGTGSWSQTIARAEVPEIPLAAQREAELRATERPVPRPTR